MKVCKNDDTERITYVGYALNMKYCYTETMLIIGKWAIFNVKKFNTTVVSVMVRVTYTFFVFYLYFFLFYIYNKCNQIFSLKSLANQNQVS